jgi:hypothetical protein
MSLHKKEIENARMNPRPTVGDFVGEFITMSERLIVSPTWGRLEGRPILKGQQIEQGAVIGHIVENAERAPLLSHTSGVFLGWMASEGERVPPGRPLARVGLSED